MELFDVRTNPRRLSRPPHSFKSPIKPQAVKFIKTHQTYLPPPNLLSKEDDIKIIQAMRKVRFEYQSIFSIEKIYEDEPNSPKLESQKETYETQHIVCDVERKGFQFYQYSANNPVEDAICSYQIPELNAFVISIFDGHGGWDLARFCAKNAPKYFQNFIKNGLKLHKYENNKIQLIKDGLSQLHYQLQNEYYKLYLKKIGQQNRKIKSVGTCAITIVMYQKKCIVANCGDSQAMSISQDRGSYNYQKLSQRYSVANRSQRLRLLQQFRQVDQNIIVEQRKNTFYLKGMLQPTRSIGDYYLKHKQHYLGDDEFKGPYLSCQPDIKVYDLKEHDRYVVVASDGLWDYLSKWEILKYVIEARNDKVTIAQRETQSEAQDQIQSKPIVSSKYLIQKILQKVSNDFDIDIEYIKSLQLGQRRSYHDDVTIAIIDIQEFFHNK